ncbi:MAG: ATP-dependent DNA helicase RecQ, partial [Sphaerobacteraceae bacterium]
MTAQVQAMLQRIIQPSGPVRLSPSIDAALRTVANDGERDGGLRDPLVHSYLADLTQTQLALLDAIPLDRLSGRVRVSVCGESPSARVVALLDLLLLWRNVCRLHGIEFPILELVPADIPGASGIPQSDRLMGGYVAGLQERAESTKDVAVADTLRWAEQLWIPDSDEEAADLIIADSGDEERLGAALGALAPNGLLVVFASGTEPGASWLSGWRRRVFQSDQTLISLGPCGQEFGNRMPVACDGCWPVRSERVEIPELEIPDDPVQALNPSRYRILGDRGYLQTSWSYMLIGREGHDQPSTPGDDSDQGEYRFVGAFQQSRPVSTTPAPGQPVNLPIFLKVCPATNQDRPTVVSTDSGAVSPQLGYGDRFEVSPINTVERGGGVVIFPADQQIGPAPSEIPERARTFLPPLISDDARSELHHGLDELAYRMFGFPGLRGFQHIILERVLTGRSVLGIAATGGGKSECFILPSMILPGITVVVSPLKSLMMDQYQERVNRRYGLGSRATWINGDLSSSQQRERLDRMIRGDYSLIYLTPEQLDKDTTITALAQADRRIGIRYLAIDEAHCISQWGHDFRPAYLSTLRRLSDAGLDPLRIALTATASPQVRADICNELGLTNRPMAENGDVYIYASNRPELNLITRISRDRPSKVSQIADELRDFASD